MQILKIAVGAVLCVFIASCATVFSRKHDTVSFISDQKGIQAFIDGDPVGTLPLQVTLKRDVFKERTVTFKKPGYTTYAMRIQKSLNTTALFNFTFWPSWSTDALSGAMIEYSPTKYMIELKPATAAAPALQRYRYHVFVGHNFHDLVHDIARGEGKFLAALLAILTESDRDKTAFAAFIASHREELVSSTTPVELLRKIRAGVSRTSPRIFAPSLQPHAGAAREGRRLAKACSQGDGVKSACICPILTMRRAFVA